MTAEYVDTDGRVRGAQVRVLNFDDPDGSDWLAINQFTVVANRHARRPAIVLFVNGLPLAVIELKNPADENATIQAALRQLQTYKAEVLSLFAFDATLIVSNGLEARNGPLSPMFASVACILVTPNSRSSTMAMRTGLPCPLAVVAHSMETRKPVRSATAASASPTGAPEEAEVRDPDDPHEHIEPPQNGLQGFHHRAFSPLPCPCLDDDCNAWPGDSPFEFGGPRTAGSPPALRQPPPYCSGVP